MLVAAVALLSWISVLATPALAVAPGRLSGEITDPAGVLGARRGEVQAAITRLYDQDRVKLYVVYVASFSGLSPTAWVDHTAALNGFGTRDVLMGVATTDRNYAISADPAAGLSTTQLDSVSATAIEGPRCARATGPPCGYRRGHRVRRGDSGSPGARTPSLNTAIAPRHGAAHRPGCRARGARAYRRHRPGRMA